MNEEKMKMNMNTAQEYYLNSGRQVADDEKFYLLCFEAARHARNRCKEFDQIPSETASDLEELQQEYPGAAVEEAFARGFQQGREYYQRICDESDPV